MLMLWNIDLLVLKKSLELLNAILTARAALAQPLTSAVKLGQLLLHRDDSFVPFIQSRGQPNHNVTLLEQQVFVPLDVNFVIFKLLPFSLELAQLPLVFLANQTLFLGQGCLELRRLFNGLATFKHLRLEHFDLHF